jgi:hypothetical protein
MRGLRDEIRAFAPALVAVAAAAAAGCGSSGGAPAAQVTQATTTQPTTNRPTTTQAVSTQRPQAPAETFTSDAYAFRVRLTEDWSEADALVDWNGAEVQGIDSPAFARFKNMWAGRNLLVAAAPVAKGTTLAAWRAAMVRAAPAVCAEASSTEETTLGGEPALAWEATCSDGYDVDKLAAVHGKRGYVVLLASIAANDDAEDARVFESIRRSFRFTR